MARRKMDVALWRKNTDNVKAYADSRTIELMEYNDGIHLRLTDGFTTIDIWPSTGKYWVKETNYYRQLEGTGHSLVERGGEKDYLSAYTERAHKTLDSIFYATELMEV